jgi:hypothetical protein
MNRSETEALALRLIRAAAGDGPPRPEDVMLAGRITYGLAREPGWEVMIAGILTGPDPAAAIRPRRVT